MCRVGVGAQPPAGFLCWPGFCFSKRCGLETEFQGGGWYSSRSGLGYSAVGDLEVLRSNLPGPPRAALRD
eukprot:8698480-Pyramimonas_sp.AAC.1